MTITTTARAVPRFLIETTLDTARLPLTVVQRAVGQQSNVQWPPAVVADAVEAHVAAWAGALLHDPELAKRGAVRLERADQLRRAATLDAAAAEVREAADDKLARQRAATSKQRAAVKDTAAKKKVSADRDAASRKLKSSTAAANKTAVVRHNAETAEEQVERVRRAGSKAALNAEARALAITREAIDADETVEVIDDAIADSAESRKASTS